MSVSVPSVRAVASGAVFGAALTAAGVYSPAVIIGQLKLEDFHMLKTFLAASATSAIVILVAQNLNLTTTKPRTPNTLRWFSAYDGNLIGGLLQGLGLALTGACPGTVLPQVVTGVPSGPFVLAGGLLGGILYSKFGKPLQQKHIDKDAVEKPTVYQNLGSSKTGGIVAFEAACIAAVASFEYFYPAREGLLVPAALGGLLIGTSQATSLALTGNALGISTAYEQIGDLFWWFEEYLLSPVTSRSSAAASPEHKQSKPRPSIKSNAFAVGTMAGAYVVSRFFALPRDALVNIGPLRAILGGAVMLFGSRLAGGCTSGHGISGMSQLSKSSIVTVAAMFGGGIAFSTFM